jgi:hypothetical protein
MPLGQTNKLEYVILPFFPIDSGVQLLSIMFSTPSGFANTSGVLPSGEANFLDFSQNEQYIYKPNFAPKTFTGAGHYTQSIVEPTGLEYYQSKQFIREPPDYINTLVNNNNEPNSFFIQALSNSKASRDYSINDFSIFNPYVHYDHSGVTNVPSEPANMVTDPLSFAFTFDPSDFITLGTVTFNLYSRQYRT